VCSRYTVTTTPEELIRELNATIGRDVPMTPEAAAFAPRFNLAPTDRAPIARARQDGSLQVDLARFGLVPHWAKDVKVGVRMLNARSETAAEKPAYREAFEHRRCLVLADGFYEWQREGKRRKPHWFHFADRRPFALAGLWARWRPKGEPEAEPMLSFTILTATAGPPVDVFHGRMPLVLRPEHYARWLDPGEVAVDAIEAMLADHRTGELEVRAVSPRVNKVGTEGPSVLEPPEG
jgi:putative SOS response-associated peptidase YedK